MWLIQRPSSSVLSSAAPNNPEASPYRRNDKNAREGHTTDRLRKSDQVGLSMLAEGLSGGRGRGNVEGERM